MKTFTKILHELFFFSPDYMLQSPEDLHLGNFKEKVRSAYDYRCLLLASAKEGRKDRAFYIGNVVFYDSSVIILSLVFHSSFMHCYPIDSGI